MQGMLLFRDAWSPGAGTWPQRGAERWPMLKEGVKVVACVEARKGSTARTSPA